MPGKHGTAWQALCEPEAQRTFKGCNPAAHRGRGPRQLLAAADREPHRARAKKKCKSCHPYLTSCAFLLHMYGAFIPVFFLQ
jgi:hypothetical protein